MFSIWNILKRLKIARLPADLPIFLVKPAFRQKNGQAGESENNRDTRGIDLRKAVREAGKIIKEI